MQKIYIDFDGVIMDTITVIQSLAESVGLDYKNYDAMKEYLTKIKYKDILDNSTYINDAMYHIENLMKCGDFDIKILTHVITLDEAEEKIKFIRKYNKDVDIIVVPKDIDKSVAINPVGAILIDDYTGNLRIWKEHGGIGVRFSPKRNGKGFFAISSLDQILEMFEEDNGGVKECYKL